MASDSLDDYLVDGEDSDGELRWALEGLREMQPAPAAGVRMMETAYGSVCEDEQANSRKRVRDKSGAVPKSKACREKMRRDKLNERFMELSSILYPSSSPKSDKASILSDASCLLVQLRNEAEKLKESNEKLHATIKDLKVEKSDLRDEKASLKADKERLEQQIKDMNLPPTGFVLPSFAYHPASAAAAAAVAFANKGTSALGAFSPAMGMWHWLPPAALDTAQDAKLWPPSA